eukprot:s14_g5.t1
MQGLHHLKAMSYREVETDNGAMQVFDYMVQQVNEDLFHADGMKLCQAVQATAEQLRCLVKEVSPQVAKKLTEEEDIDFFPKIVQNWMIDMFMNLQTYQSSNFGQVLPSDAAARLGVALKFATHLLLSSSRDILQAEDLNGVVIKIPGKIHTPEDVDSLLEQTDWTAAAEAVEAVPAEKVLEEIQEMGNMHIPTTLKLPARARLPKRWQPWKFLSVAMVVPWLLIHTTALQLHALRAL